MEKKTYKFIKNENGTISGINTKDIAHQDGSFTFLRSRNPKYEWIQTSDLHESEDIAQRNKPAKYIR